jgi:streptogramin lyase
VRSFLLALLLAFPLSAATLTTLDVRLDQPFGLTTGPDGALYVCDANDHRVIRIDVKSGKFSTFAGSGHKGYSGDGGPATAASLSEPYELVFDSRGDLYFVERLNHTVRKVDHATGNISTLAGTGTEGDSGDGGPAVKAQLRQPHSIALAPDGRLLVCDILNYRIRAIDLKTGTIDTWAGTGKRAPTPDSAPITGTPLNGPRALARDRAGNFYLVLREGNTVYRLDTKSGQMNRIAGTGEKGYSGDGSDARTARLSGPKGVACAPDGSIYIADTENHAIRRIDTGGIITTVAGTGERGDGPDGDPLHTKLARPHGIFVDAKGVVYIGDSENHRVRVLR